MPWDYSDLTEEERFGRFGSPDFDEAPITWLAKRLLDVIDSQQDAAITFWNTRWSAIIGHTLLHIDRSSMHVGTPLDLHGRAIYLTPISDFVEFDNYITEGATFQLVYVTGDVELTDSPRMTAVEVSGFYTKMLRSIIQTAPVDLITDGWPTGGEPPGISKSVRTEQPDSNIFGNIRAELGIQTALTIRLQIESNPLYL